MRCSAQVAAAFCSHPLCHLRSEPWGGPRQRGATRITAASLRSHAATASFQAPPPPGLRHGVGGCMGTPPPPKGFCPSQPRSMETGDKGHRVLGQGAKRGHQNLSPPPWLYMAGTPISPTGGEQHLLGPPNTPTSPAWEGGGAVSGWGGAMAGIGAPRDCTPPHTAAPPQRGSCRIRSAPPLFNTSGGAGRGLGGGQGAERPCGASPEPTGWGHKAHGSSIIKEDFIRARRWGDPQASPPPWGPCTAPMEPSPHPVGERTTARGGAGGCGRHHPPINTN